MGNYPKSQLENNTSMRMVNWQEFSFVILIQIIFSTDTIVNF